MSTTVKAAVFSEQGAPPQIRDLVLPDPGPGQVRVRLAAAGVCHSDLSLSNGTLAQKWPAVLGHEGAGTVDAVGEDVTGLVPGQQVILNWAPPCRECWFCLQGEPHLCEHALDRTAQPYAELSDGTPVYPGLGCGAFAEATVVPAHAVIPLPDGIDPSVAAVLGCAMLTGWGAVNNSAGVREGQSAVVLGLGGVGLSVLQSARLAGADPVIAVDVSPDKEELARSLGATDFLVADDSLTKAVRRLTGGRGADHAFEVVGSAKVVRSAWSASRRGGTITVVGVGRADDEVSFNALELFHQARTLRGCVYGSSDPTRDIPLIAEQVRSGELKLSAMVTDEISLEGVPEAFERMARGKGGRSLVRFGR
ncbi:S-(hydroxymethyl)glutathione dehydrogenase/alcohol dehydrogenase [Nocardiopsis arvandica]|uniref:S-(Hydroxymethyl)glutathione dehydrogenase/alcohol dehydrogenase n=1 Tax=Nocardiopsis sinuspersici TaxID=501010 RepID=A0A7Y9XG21_9ACTN|nr:Zn-dependent alcohol dehydrogenase [Nocardiopsis sinuspersici]NYH55043.1 S-(hydroxymethyl)glutathione dehydrogenase/alcohol dehydrogenase [Nocardiopsis sinuspersici]